MKLRTQISPPLPQGKAVPSTSDMRYSLLYLAGVCATAGADERARAAAAATFLMPDYAAADALTHGEPGKRLFQRLEKAGVVPLAWGENG